MTPPDVSVVVPCYQSEKTLPALYERLAATLTAAGMTFEVVFVDDASPDGAWGVIECLRERDPGRVVAVQLMRNFGQHNALMAGFHHARGAVVVTLDDDLQNPPEEVPKLLAALADKNLDVAYGNYASKKHAALRNLASGLSVRFFKLVFRTPVTPTAFRAVRGEVIRAILGYRLNFTIVDGLLAWTTTRVGAVLVEHHPRAEGRSGYSFGKLLLQAANLFTNFSLIPLQLVSALGLFTAAGGFAAAGVYLVRYLNHGIGVPGYASTIIAILVLGGVQLLALGVVGEYLGRVLININQKPQYVERQVLRPPG